MFCSGFVEKKEKEEDVRAVATLIRSSTPPLTLRWFLKLLFVPPFDSHHFLPPSVLVTFSLYLKQICKSEVVV